MRERSRSRKRWGWGTLTILGLILVPAAAVAVAAIKTHSRPPVRREDIEAAGDQWGAIFGVPTSWILAIAKIESGFKPDTVNWSIRSIPLGGAWGPLQMTATTAGDWAKRLASHEDAYVREVAARWHGNGQALIDDLELAVLLSTAFMARLKNEFGTFALTAAAYHQGAGKIRQMLKDGIAPADIPMRLPPKGKEYVQLALAAGHTTGVA
jgi:soluble lytic murein transglycosylase-like protein